MNLGTTSLREPFTRRLSWTIAASVMIAALLWPALWNGFPIVFHDTGGYLARPFEGTLTFGRSAFYGAFRREPADRPGDLIFPAIRFDKSSVYGSSPPSPR